MRLLLALSLSLSLSLFAANHAAAFDVGEAWNDPGLAPGAGGSSATSDWIVGTSPDGQHPVQYWVYSDEAGGYTLQTYQNTGSGIPGPLSGFQQFLLLVLSGEIDTKTREQFWREVGANFWGFGGDPTGGHQDPDVTGGGSGGGSSYVCITEIMGVCIEFGSF